MRRLQAGIFVGGAQGEGCHFVIATLLDELLGRLLQSLPAPVLSDLVAAMALSDLAHAVEAVLPSPVLSALALAGWR